MSIFLTLTESDGKFFIKCRWPHDLRILIVDWAKVEKENKPKNNDTETNK